VYWLIGQFKGEREGLYKELHYEFLQAQDQALDSSLHVMLQPLLNDSLGIRDSVPHAAWVSKGAVFDSIQVSSNFISDSLIGDRIIQFDIRGEEHGTLSQTATYEINATPGHDAVLRGVKMIIQMSEDSLGKTGVNSFSSLPEIDSLMLIDLASKRLKKLDHSEFKILWYNDSSDFIHSESSNRLRYFSGMSHPPMIFEVTNYEPFLFKKIIPQVLFGLLLLILTGSAFIFTYRSLRKQLLLNTLRNEFISNVSHELKTPVSTVKVALESLQSYDQKKDTKVTEEYLSMASKEMDRLDLLIQKILNQSLLESRNVHIQKENIDLVELSNNLILTMKPRISELHGKLILNSAVEQAIIPIDELYIQGVLMNLVDNAIKYGGNPPEVNINISKDNIGLRISVSDNGNGIPEEYHKKVFERFFRVPTGDRHNVKGYGLGLSFAKEVIMQHGGYIELETSSSGGSIFTIIFPLVDEI
jgi:signal transduction histidine kinase